MMASRIWLVSLVAICIGLVDSAASTLTGIPTVPFTTSDDGSFDLKSITSLIVDSDYADARDEDGETLIPPSLQEFADTFAGDLKEALGLVVSVSTGHASSGSSSIFLTVGDASQYTGANGDQTSEGYTLTVSSNGITISGASPLGAWWGTRTVLQQALLHDAKIPFGEGNDAPGWRTRGMMLDVARHYYPAEFIIELCSYMSFFKQNTFQIHLSDNEWTNVGVYSQERVMSLVSRFRLWTDAEEVAGLNDHKNESYTREIFDDIQSSCAARGVTILPEIEAPGHSLPFVQWKPELGLPEDLTLLNISHPDTIPTIKTVWSTFVDWFQSKTVSMGADEYTADIDEYNRFVTAISDHIQDISGKAVRIWGTYPPKPKYDNIAKDISIQHWTFDADNPYPDYIQNGYSVLNSDDTYYTIGKWSDGVYPNKVPLDPTFSGDPSNDGPWYPNIFDTEDADNNPSRSEPLVLGAITPQWNDWCQNATVVSEAYYVWRQGIPALADKQWGGTLSSSDFASTFDKLLSDPSTIPGQNLERTVPSLDTTILNYTLSTSNIERPLSPFLNHPPMPAGIEDLSGNAYHGSTNCPFNHLPPSSSSGEPTTLAIRNGCSLATRIASKGRDYTFTIRLRIDSRDDGDVTLSWGKDSTLMLTPTLTLFASENYYRLSDTKIPDGQWTDVSVIGRGNQTFARVDDGTEEEFQVSIGVRDQYFVQAEVAVEAPAFVIAGSGAGWEGEVASVVLTSET